MSLRGCGRTDLALALRTAVCELVFLHVAERLAIVLSDCRATADANPLAATHKLDRVDVLKTSADADAVAADQTLARQTHRRYLAATRYTELQDALAAALR